MSNDSLDGHEGQGSQRQTYDQFVLFGDSITQQAESQEKGFAFAPALRNEYIRRLDVINRGFSGYTAQLGLHILPQFMPSVSQANVRLITVFFGANDACLPGIAQHVPLDKYCDYMLAIIKHPALAVHKPEIILITPGPVDEYQLEPTDVANGHGGLQRTAANTQRYARACRDLGNSFDLPVVDLWTLFMNAAGWEEGQPLTGSKEVARNDVLGRLLADGLHFGPEGYKMMFDETTRVISEKLPELSPENLPFVFPPWPLALKEHL